MESRTINTIKNSLFNIGNQILAILLQFVLRTVFIRCLALEYLGISGLFANILSMLSLTELGLGAAIVCSMYKPLAEGNYEEINKLFNVYRKVYGIIGFCIFAIGISLIPFLRYLVKDSSNIPNLRSLYFLYLIDTTASYFFAHYRSVLSADQKEYINANNRSLFLVIQIVFQIILLYSTHNYIIFLLVKILCNILSSYVVSLKVKRRYPYLSLLKKVHLDSGTLQLVKKDMIGVFSTRIAMTTLNSTDSMIMSAFLGSIVTAYYSNYSLLVGTIGTAMGLVFSSVQASIGNYCVVQTKEEQQELFYNLQYASFCVYSFCTICLWGLLSPFVSIWLGKSFVLSNFVVATIILKFYLGNTRQIVLSFLSVNHLLNKLAIKNGVEVVINLVVSIYLVQKVGIAGIFIGTCIGMIATSLWFEPYILFKERFKCGITIFGQRVFLYTGVTVIGCYFANRIVSTIYNGSLLSFVLCMIATGTIALLIITIPFLRTAEFNYLLRKTKGIIQKNKT